VGDNSGTAACDSALDQLRTDYAQAQKCAADEDCAYFNGRSAVPRDRTGQFIPTFVCGDLTPTLVVGNARYVMENRATLNRDLSAVRSSCALSEFFRSCRARGGFVASSAPVCRQSVCARGP
jgi:hypothetical protein